MIYLSANEVISIVGDAIIKRAILAVRYQHTTDAMIVDHTLAPFDIGTTNPQRVRQFADNLYAYSYTRIDRKTNLPDPKVVPFNINNFLKMASTGEVFDETDLCLKNLNATGYDYRTCQFALRPDRDWFR